MAEPLSFRADQRWRALWRLLSPNAAAAPVSGGGARRLERRRRFDRSGIAGNGCTARSFPLPLLLDVSAVAGSAAWAFARRSFIGRERRKAAFHTKKAIAKPIAKLSGQLLMRLPYAFRFWRRRKGDHDRGSVGRRFCCRCIGKCRQRNSL